MLNEEALKREISAEMSMEGENVIDVLHDAFQNW